VTSVAIPEGTVQRPGFWRVLWELIVGYLFSLIALGVPVIGLVLVGVFDWHDGFRGWPLNGPYVPAGVWAILADLFCAIVVVLVSSVIIAGSMQAELRLPVSRLVVGVVVALTGVAPFLDARLLPLTGPAALIVATYLVRRFAIARVPPLSIRPPRWLLFAGAAAGIAGVTLTASYGVAHPLWPNSVNANGRQISFILRNAGFAEVTLVDVSTPARVGATPWEGRPVRGVVVPARGSRWITLLERGCPPKDLTVRYRIFGRVTSAPLRPVPPPLELGC